MAAAASAGGAAGRPARRWTWKAARVEAAAASARQTRVGTRLRLIAGDDGRGAEGRARRRSAGGAVFTECARPSLDLRRWLDCNRSAPLMMVQGFGERERGRVHRGSAAAGRRPAWHGQLAGKRRSEEHTSELQSHV